MIITTKKNSPTIQNLSNYESIDTSFNRYNSISATGNVHGLPKLLPFLPVVEYEVNMDNDIIYSQSFMVSSKIYTRGSNDVV